MKNLCKCLPVLFLAIISCSKYELLNQEDNYHTKDSNSCVVHDNHVSLNDIHDIIIRDFPESKSSNTFEYEVIPFV